VRVMNADLGAVKHLVTSNTDGGRALVHVAIVKNNFQKFSVYMKVILM